MLAEYGASPPHNPTGAPCNQLQKPKSPKRQKAEALARLWIVELPDSLVGLLYLFQDYGILSTYRLKLFDNFLQDFESFLIVH